MFIYLHLPVACTIDEAKGQGRARSSRAVAIPGLSLAPLSRPLREAMVRTMPYLRMKKNKLKQVMGWKQ